MLLKISFLFVEFPWNIWPMYECANYKFFKQSKSLISSQFLSELGASDISDCIKPFDFAYASLVLLSLGKSEAVLISINQSSNCEESLPWNIGISWNRVFTKDVFFCAVHKVSVYCCRTSSRGSGGADGQSVKVNLFNSHSRWLMASVGWVLLASTLCCK